MKTHELTGKALDWAVQKILFAQQGYTKPWILERHAAGDPCGSASTDWAQGGPIIERERIHIRPDVSTQNFRAFVIRSPEGQQCRYIGATPLVAAMRCFVAMKLGEEVEIPENLFSQR